MSYFHQLVFDTLNDMQQRAICKTIREDHPLIDLYDYLAKNNVESLNKELKEESLPSNVKKQYSLFCEVIQEIAQ